MNDAKWWQKLFGLAPKTHEPAGRPGHSMEGRVVTGEPVDWSRYDGCMRLNVVGESNYQDALSRVSKCPAEGEHGYECSAELVPEPDNPYDRLAVRVEVDGELVGYLPRGSAKQLHRRLLRLRSEGKESTCMAYIGRGTDHPNLGISLRLPYGGVILDR